MKYKGTDMNDTYYEILFKVSDEKYGQIYQSIQVVLAVLAIIMNTLVITYGQSRRPADRCDFTKVKCSLAFAGILSGVLVLMSAFVARLKLVQYDQIMKLIVPFITVSFNHLAYMAFMRFNAINNPFRHHRHSLLKSDIMRKLVLLWVISLSIGLFYPIGLLFFHDVTTKDKNITLVLVSFISCRVLPYLITMVLTLMMYVAYKYQKHQHRGCLPARAIQERQRLDTRLTTSIIWIVVGYTVTNIPFNVFFIKLLSDHFQKIEPICTTTCPNFIIRNAQGTLQMSIGIVDVFVYSVNDEKFIEYLKSIITRMFCRHHELHHKTGGLAASNQP